MIGRTEIEALLVAHGKIAVGVIVESKGSSPRDSGAILLIYPGGTLGTIGGGTVEYQVIERAQGLLEAGGLPEELSFPLGPDLDQCCGGHISVQLGLAAPTGDQIWPGGPTFPRQDAKRPVILYGAGHVGQAVLRALTPLPFQVTLVDARPAMPKSDAGTIVTPLPEAVAQEAGPEVFHVVLTHSHALDLEIVSEILAKPFEFCGLIGSETKRALFERRLNERGFTPETIAKLTCPIGLSMLKDKRPEVIAASVAVQLLLRDQMLQGRP